MKIPIYIVEQKTGQVSPDGEAHVIVISVKLTREAAEFVCSQYENARVRKLVATKETE